ncbi:MAG: hypothetical protein ACR2PH_07185 [Desulfobulbia bacterium]
MSELDRAAICNIISEMLDNPDEYGIYPTSTAYTRLEHYCEQVRHEAIGWMHADNCIALDNGFDPRLVDVPDILRRAKRDLSKPEPPEDDDTLAGIRPALQLFPGAED